jgi:hypothetical protein
MRPARHPVARRHTISWPASRAADKKLRQVPHRRLSMNWRSAEVSSWPPRPCRSHGPDLRLTWRLSRRVRVRGRPRRQGLEVQSTRTPAGARDRRSGCYRRPDRLPALRRPQADPPAQILNTRQRGHRLASPFGPLTRYLAGNGHRARAARHSIGDGPKRIGGERLAGQRGIGK